MSKFLPGMADSHDVKRARLFRVDDLLNSAVYRVHVIVVTRASAGVFAVHSDVAMPFGIPVSLKACRVK